MFIRQYPEVFHMKDGMVTLTKPRRNYRQVFHFDPNDGSIAKGDDSLFESPKVQVLISNSPDFANAKPVVLPASDFSVILVLRRILRQALDKGLHVAIVIKQLIDFPHNVQKFVGVTRFELHFFVEKYKDFFDILSPQIDDHSLNDDEKQSSGKMPHRIPTSFCLRINADALYMQSHLIDDVPGRCANRNGTSRLDQHVGRVFRVAKSWGIIDLGNHVHVFFDKSIFRNVSDLQKVFQVSLLMRYFSESAGSLMLR
uniref:PORR domain-containing protein n=1 Tax=Mesocestoides corti TaxID=53468 RepID=A0A5K3EHX1_MESCO